MEHFLSRFCTVLATFAALVVFSGTACAKEKVTRVKPDAFTRPVYKTLVVGSCPRDHAAASEQCSRARLLYPRYPKMPWLNRLIAQSIILPMLAEAMGEEPPRLPGKESGESRYKANLKSLVQRNIAHAPGEEKPPAIDFGAELRGYDENDLSPSSQPRPARFGPYLQFVLSHESSREYEAHPPGTTDRFIVVDTIARRVLGFDDLIVPGRERALEKLQQEAFRHWLKTRQSMSEKDIDTHLADPAFAFSLSRNWRIATNGVVFRFAMYEIGPRTFGMPEIHIGKNQLRDIIQPDIWAQIP
jgi:hypothetical protein